MERRLFLGMTLLAPAARAVPLDSIEEGRRAFASLMKVSLEPPAVKAAVRSTVVEGGLIVEDIDWPGEDGETVPAILIRPETAGEPRPAIVCLHGTGGS